MLKSYYHKTLTEAGCDEAGRGALAGPVVAAAVILPKRFRNRELNDSKKLTEKQRYHLREVIIKSAIAWNVAFVDNDEIDKINILKASIKAMHIAVDGLSIIPQMLLIDGNRFYQYRDIPHKTIIKGDGIYMSIAAASVLAKTYRDDYMKKIHNELPQYGWNKNKGYPTEAHRRSISDSGISFYHRKSFSLYESQLSIDF